MDPHQGIRQHILANRAEALNHGLGADANKLMDRDHSRHKCVIFYDHMAGKSGRIHHNHMITDFTIMRDVSSRLA